MPTASPWDHADSLFRFVQVRAPEAATAPSKATLARVRTYFPDQPTAFYSRLAGLRAASTIAEIGDAARDFIDATDRTPWTGARFRGQKIELDPWLLEIDDYLASKNDRPDIDDFERRLIGVLATKDTAYFPDGKIIWPAFQTVLAAAWRDLGDSVIAVSIWPLSTPASQACLMRAIRVVGLLNEFVDAGWEPPVNPGDSSKAPLTKFLTTGRITDTLLDGLVLLPPALFPLPGMVPAPSPVASESVPAAGTSDREPAATPLTRSVLANAITDLMGAVRSSGQDHLPTLREVNDRLTAVTRGTLQEHRINQDQPATLAIDALARQHASSPYLRLAKAESPATAALRVMTRDNAGLQLGMRNAGSASPWNAANLTRSPIVGDLLVVRQELLRYEEGEIANIENVLARERKLHVHEFKDVQEQETTTVTEHEEERTHDNQTTDRQELSQEATKQSQSQAGAEAGVTVSGQYGPVNLSANAQFSYSTSTSESNRTASTFSKEVVDRSVDRVKDRRLETRRVLRRQELLDRNEHEFNNATPDHVVGIYQWVDKIYEAATFNYGVRMMLDVMVPEPAMYLQYAQALAASTGVTAEPPPSLNITDGGVKRELEARDIEDLVSLDDLAATFRVRGLKPPPPRWVTVGLKLGEDAPLADKTADQLRDLATKTGEAKIPKGYAPSWYTGIVSLLSHPDFNVAVLEPPNSAIRGQYAKTIGVTGDGTTLPGIPAYSNFIVGNNTLTVGPFVDSLRLGVANKVSHAFQQAQPTGAVPVGPTGQVGEEGTLPVTLSIIGSPTYVAAVTIVCERTEQSYRAWQLEQFEAVVTAWEAWKQEFEAAVRAARNARTAAPGATANSATSSTVVTTELRRLVLQMLEVPMVGVGGMVTPFNLTDPEKPVPPALKPTVSALMGRLIQFVEQAFEWPQLTYRLYPYYWKPESTWPATMLTNDRDPAYAEFLQSGCARVVIPVRPGFEVAVCSHLGVNPALPWQAGKPPIVDDDPYLSIAEEIKSAQTALKAPVRVDEPWLVRLPTTLIKLKADANLPVFRQPTPPAVPVP